MEKVSKKIKIQFQGKFSPSVVIGDVVTFGENIGKLHSRKILERFQIPVGAKIQVDDGIFIEEKTHLFTIKKGLSQEKIYNKKQGLVIIKNDQLIIGGGAVVRQVKSPVNGRVILLANSECTIDGEFIKMPIMISRGGMLEGNIVVITKAQLGLASLERKLRRKLVFYMDQLTKEVFHRLESFDVIGIVTPYMQWKSYIDIFQNKGTAVGVFLGFGQGHMIQSLEELFEKIDGAYSFIDFSESIMYLPVNAIMKNNINSKVIFRDDLWGKEIESIEEIDIDKRVVTLRSKERLVVDNSEITKII